MAYVEGDLPLNVGNTGAKALIVFNPPLASAGKNLTYFSPLFTALDISEALDVSIPVPSRIISTVSS